MVEEIEGVVYDVPLPRRVPPDEAEYQLIVAVEEAVRTTVPVPHLETLDAVGAAGALFTIACTGILALRQLFPVST